jgi:putative peptidoglycan lipid II flippase
MSDPGDDPLDPWHAGAAGASAEAESVEPGSDPAVTDPTAEPALMRRVARSTILLTATAAVGQVFTLLRELFIASQVGATLGLDALLVAAVIPQMAASLLSSGTGAAVIPGYLEAERRLGRPGADRLLGTILTWTLLIGTAISLGVTAIPAAIVAVSGPGLPAAYQADAAGYVPYLAPMLVLSALGGLLAATFQVHERLVPVAIAWAAGPIASVVALVVLWGSLGLTAVAIAMTLQQGIVLVVLAVLAWRRGWLPRPTLSAPRDELVAFGRHAVPLTLSASVLQFNLLTDRAIATLLGAGAVSALRYGEGIIRLPMNAIGPAWGTAIYPALVRASQDRERQSLGGAAGEAMRYVTAIFVPLSIATMALAPLIVGVVYVRGAFGAEDAILTSVVLVGFGPLLFLNMANSILTGAHNARRRGVFLMWMGISNAILNALFNVGFGLAIGVAGVALSTSATVGIIQAIKAHRLAAIDPAFALPQLTAVLVRSVVASTVVATPVAVIAWVLPVGLGTLPSLVLLTALSAFGMIGYVAVGRAIGLLEPLEVVRAIVASRPARLRRA